MELKQGIMDIQSEKLELIKWLAGIKDSLVIKQIKLLQRSNQKKVNATLTDAEKSAIDQGLKSIKEGRVHSHKNVMKSTKEKYPSLF